ncbi:hypothetical protein FRC02_002068 [Tulasnella sp. 418]|nr:hypothetical protein FRC02_002068 [Tulasnella sp. 418]
MKFSTIAVAAVLSVISSVYAAETFQCPQPNWLIAPTREQCVGYCEGCCKEKPYPSLYKCLVTCVKPCPPEKPTYTA